MNIRQKFAKYVSLNVIGMVGVSAYILADTFFISKAQGASGITALNLVLPIYSLIYAIGAMIGIGSATRFSILRAQKNKEAEFYFSNAIMWALIISVPFILGGIFIPGQIVSVLGGDAEISEIGSSYTRIFMAFTPFFICDKVVNAFVRNDGNPGIAMIATFSSSLFNIIFDYILMFPLNMGMSGAALATALSPMVGIMICSAGHLLRPRSTLRFHRILPSLKRLKDASVLGISAFIGEIASGITTMVFNFLILRLAGNDGVAAYGVIANTALVATAIFNGIAQGAQPILSESFGKARKNEVNKLLKYSIVTSLVLSIIIIILSQVFPEQLTSVFNSENNQAMAEYAHQGIRLYFIGYLFAGFNIVGTGYLSATDHAMESFIASIIRGFAAIILCGFVLSYILGMTGIWIAFPAAEFLTAIVTVYAIRRGKT